MRDEMPTLAARRDAEQPGASARRAAASPTPRADGFAVRPLALAMLQDHADAIRSLANRALLRNVFYESPFLIHAAGYLRDAGVPQIVSIWRGNNELVGLFPMAAPRAPFGPRIAHGWLSQYMTDGTPLIDAACADGALAAFLDWLDDQGFCGVAFPGLDPDGPYAALLWTVAASRETQTAQLGAFERAVLRPREGDAATGASRKRRELQRQLRRLEDGGAVTVVSAVEGATARAAFEQFLALEAQGWKGRAGTALIQNVAAAAFARGALGALADEGRCRIDVMEIDGRPIAATVELHAGDRSYFWKTAYDETRARYSPGVQMSFRLTRQHQLSRRFVLVDSCAEADHPMINRLWPDRARVANIAIGASPDRRAAFAVAVRLETAARGLRALAKRLYRFVRPVKAR